MPPDVSAQTAQETDIKNVLARRSDLSTFIVHLTKDDNGETAHDRLKSIINDWTIKAGRPLGSAIKKLEENGRNTDSQKCVCFTETPLEYLYLLCQNIAERETQLASYGIAITKKQARKNGANPVWYVDITSGHDWLMNPVNRLIEESVTSGNFDNSSIANIAPFIEQMGDNRTTGGRLKEFWWEREWRYKNNFSLPGHILVICPEDKFSEFDSLLEQKNKPCKCIDPNWGLEKIIARLAGFENADIDIF